MLMSPNYCPGVPVSLAAVAALLAVACSGGDDRAVVTIDGSSTVYPVTEAVAEEFRSVEPDVRVTVGVSGTGGGFQKFCSGEIDISAASRPIQQQEIDACDEVGVEYLRFRIGLDGLAVVVHPKAEFLECLTLDELATLWHPDNEDQVQGWNQVRSNWPSLEVTLFGPDTASGTFDFFTEAVNGESGASRADYTAATDDNVLVTGISGTEGASGYFGYAYYAENRDKLKLVAVDGGDGCVFPSDDTVSDGTYVLARPLFIYVNRASLAEKRQVREFVRFYLSDPGLELVPEVGYTAIPTEDVAESRAALEAATGE